MNAEKYNNFDYMGWIPCLSGDLVFKYTSPSLGIYDKYSINFSDRNVETGERKYRFIIASSVCDLKDEINSKENGLIRMVVTGRVSLKEKLFQGHIYIIGLEKNITDTPLLKLLNQLEENSHNMRKGQDKVDFSKNLAGLVKDKGGIYKLLMDIKEAYIHCVKFEIESSGITKLKYEGIKKSAVDHLVLPLVFTNEILRINKYTNSRQAFYYLKYLLHKHAHHHPSNDSLTTIHKIKKNTSKNCCALINDIKKALVDIKRGDVFSKQDLAGVATYGKSLLNTIKKDKCLKKNLINIECLYISNLGESIGYLHTEFNHYAIGPKGFVTSAQQMLTIIFLFVSPLLLILIKNKDKFLNINDDVFYLNYIKNILGGDINLILTSYTTLIFIISLAHIIAYIKNKSLPSLFCFIQNNAYTNKSKFNHFCVFLSHTVEKFTRYFIQSQHMIFKVTMFIIMALCFMLGSWLILDKVI